MPPRLVWLALIVITIFTFYFPGSTYLQSDTQIYVPILEHLMDPSLLRQDLIAQYPHVRYTMYDDVSIALRRLSSLSFRRVLQVQNAAFRFGGVTGAYLMATAAGLAPVPALFTSSVISLGATIVGPAVLTIEYEPVPRGFALCAGILMMGLASHRRFRGAGIAGAIGFLYHAPTVAPIWAVYLLLAIRAKHALWQAAPPLLTAGAILFITAQFDQSRQPLFTHIDDALETLQRTRSSYNWISIWGRQWLPHHAALLTLTFAAYWRCRGTITGPLRRFVIDLPVYAACTVPLSFALLEGVGWSAVAQFQPMRSLAMLTIIASFSALVAACHARTWAEASAWLIVPYLIPANTTVWQVPETNRVILVAGLAALAGVGLVTWRSYRTAGAVALGVVAVAALLAIPGYGGIQNYPPLHTAQLDELAAWARTQTPKDAVFVFPYAAKRLEPGVFRAEALRAVYVDWKTGGQVNYFPEMAFEWWRRWQDLMVAPAVTDLGAFAARGIHYVITDPSHPVSGHTPLFSNKSYLVYATGR
jgi:hypothetical protein